MEDEYQLEKESNPDVSKREEIPVESSGFKFNPRDAFGGFDLSSIDRDVIKFDDEELKRRELKENTYFGSMLRPTTNPTERQKKREPDRTVFETEPKTWKDFGLKSIDNVEPNEMPAKISVKDAEEKIKKGFDVEAKDGSVVHFGKELFHHWKNEKTEDFEKTKKDRLEDLNLAIQTLENPVERWDKVNQHDYIGMFTKDGQVRCIFLTVDNSGNVRTFYANNINGINKTRKGLTYEKFK